MVLFNVILQPMKHISLSGMRSSARAGTVSPPISSVNAGGACATSTRRSELAEDGDPGEHHPRSQIHVALELLRRQRHVHGDAAQVPRHRELEGHEQVLV